MRLLFAFTMSQCFGFVFHENSNVKVGFDELYDFGSSENLLNCVSICFYENLGKNISFAISNYDQRYRIDDKRLIDTCPNIFQISEINRENYVTEPSSILRFQQHYCYLKKSRIYGRRLLNYLAKTMTEDSINNNLFDMNDIESLANIEDETKQIYSKRWDEWGNWSTCSVTCGNGRQVRWRHCSGKDCTKGLKKAQIKPCRTKKCDKNILNWLGIKT